MTLKEGYKVLPLFFSEESDTCHSLFIKAHSSKNPSEDKPLGRTLFVSNIPPYANESSLRRIFTNAGCKVNNVILQKDESSKDEPKSGFKTAYLVFEDHHSLSKALNSERLEPLSTDDFTLLTGMKKWAFQYNSNIHDHDKLKNRVDSFMKNYDRRQEKEKSIGEGNGEDDEGWTLVTKKNRNPGLARKESVETKLIQKNKRKSGKRELKNFYTFQIKEQKMKNLIELRNSFQKSKEKVESMKKLRNFKPY